jgi:alcohol dehydrogenase (cytochrome c)
MPAHQFARDDVWRLVRYLDRVLTKGYGVAAERAASQDLAAIEPVGPADLVAGGRPGEWLTYSHSYSGQRHSPLAEITRENVAKLRPAWQRQLLTSAERVQTSPIVRGSTMFVTEPPNRVLALDARSGHVHWTYSRDLPQNIKLCCSPTNRGVALLGDRVYVGTLDAHLVALDARTGKVQWDIAVANPAAGFSITGAPLAVGDMIVTGVAGGEFAVRGFLDAYDAATGKRRWRFYTIPAPGEPGSETWAGNSIERGGGPTWLTGSYDPELRLIYWGVGNPSPNFAGDGRHGDNLYSNSVVALDAATGKLRWHFQFTPHDTHDWDAVQIPVLVDAKFGSTTRKLMAWANRNAFYYLLDRTSGEFLLGTPYAKQTWADGLDESGRPRVRPDSVPSRDGALVYPSVAGATNWWSPSYDPGTNQVFVPMIERGSMYYTSSGSPTDHRGQVTGGSTSSVADDHMVTAVKALDLTTGRTRWQYARPPRKTVPEMGGLVSTDGHLVFGGDLETFFALDSDTGSELWSFETGGFIRAAPITYAIDGRQYVAIAAGRAIMVFALPGSDR